jgi:hypothetical protein
MGILRFENTQYKNKKGALCNKQTFAQKQCLFAPRTPSFWDGSSACAPLRKRRNQWVVDDP